MFEAVLFDMDGVLIDSVEIGLQVRKGILLHQYGVELEAVPDPEGEEHRAVSMDNLLARVDAFYGTAIDPRAFARASQQHLREYLAGHDLSADPALVAFLEELRQHDIQRVVVSSGQRAGVDMKLGALGIGDYFSDITSGNDVRNHKPHPEPYQHTLQKLGLAPEVCVAFEDSLTGIQSARAAGCEVIGFTQYNPPKEPLSGVLATIPHWSEITYAKLQALYGR